MFLSYINLNTSSYGQFWNIFNEIKVKNYYSNTIMATMNAALCGSHGVIVSKTDAHNYHRLIAI